MLARYNPTYNASEAERIRATANMVGWDVPVEYVSPDSAAAASPAAAEGEKEEEAREESRRKVEERKARYEGL